MTKTNTLATAISLLLLSSMSHAASVTVPTSGVNAKLTLNNVGGLGASATLVALDNAAMHGGQVFQVSSTGAVSGAVDATFSPVNGTVIISTITQDAIVSYNATLLLTKATVPYELTVTNLTTTSLTNGATTQVVFNQGPKGDAGAAGAAGAKGDTGPMGLKGDAGAAGAKGDAGAAGAKGDVGPQGPQGLQGDSGPEGPRGFPGDTLTGAANADLQYWNGTGWSNVTKGTNGQVLKVVGGVPTWSAP